MILTESMVPRVDKSRMRAVMHIWWPRVPCSFPNLLSSACTNLDCLS